MRMSDEAPSVVEPLSYRLLPFRFAEIDGHDDSILLTSEAGDFQFVTRRTLNALVAGKSLPADIADKLEARQLIARSNDDLAVRLLATKLRTRKSFLREGPSLHIFVLTLTCDHSCTYCQVSRSLDASDRFKMTAETAIRAVDRLFECPSNDLTVEFQGGEPLLAFDRLRQIVEAIELRNETARKNTNFTITSTLHHLNDEILTFLRDHRIHVSTSLDGPASIHNSNRPLPSRDSHVRTLSGIAKVRDTLGFENLSALTTLTARSLKEPQAIIDEYVRLGFRSIFLRPLSHFGFAARSRRRDEYRSDEFVEFYDRALSYILKLNREGHQIEEVYAGILLSSILTKYPTTYVDLRSPVGAGFGTLVYNYDGGVYASDEGRMLAEMGQHALRLGSVNQSYDELMRSDAIQLLAAAGLAESLPGCSDCAFVSYCGPDPASALSRSGEPVGHRATSEHCQRHLGLFKILFRHLRQRDPAVLKTFSEWVYGPHRTSESEQIDVAAA